jgi:hypothetical protein
VSSRFRASSSFVLALIVGSFASVHGCFARDTGELVRPTDDDAGGKGPILIDGGAEDARFELPAGDPHAVLGVDPPHGPFAGGQLAIVRGNGLASSVRVWFGATEVAEQDVVPIDPSRVQVLVPPGAAGAVDVALQNGDDASTRRALTGGYVYDQFYAEPSSGPTSGGTLIRLRGDSTSWDSKTAVEIELEPCKVTELVSATELVCATPRGTPGTKPIRVTTKDGVTVDVLDAFTYGDSDDGFKGGLSGQPLATELKVIALDSFTGAAIPGAKVIAGDDLATAVLSSTDAKGIALVNDAALGPKRSVTIAKKCFHPITFVDVPVDTVTAFLDPVLSPACASEGDPPPVGGGSGSGSTVEGELVWKSQTEFKRQGWTNVPAPKSDDEKLVAYVFRLSSDPTRQFDLPQATSAVTPESKGGPGYEFSLSGSPGNLTLYALAGIENRAATPPRFTAYSMGLTKGVGAKPGGVTSSIYINVDVPLDHALTLSVGGPKATKKGPDRAQASVAVRVGEQGYAILPVSQQTRLLPISEPFRFVGVPPLVGSLLGTQYVATARAYTGEIDSTPRSVVGLLASTTTSQTITLDEFVEVPVLDVPGTNGGFSGQDLATSYAAGGASVELTVYEIQSGGGLMSWTIAAPAGKNSIRLPDLRALDPELALLPGPITIGVTVAHIDEFDYGALRYRQLDRRGWDAYATDVFYAHY